MAPYDVILAKVSVGESFKIRWCVVVEALPDGSVRVFPCSSEFDLCRERMDFEIDRDLPEFAATGFTRSSYVIEGDMLLVPPERIGPHRGSLTGELGRRFARWAGTPDPSA